MEDPTDRELWLLKGGICRDKRARIEFVGDKTRILQFLDFGE